MSQQEAIKHEQKIVWLYDLNEYPWVREHFANLTLRQGFSQSYENRINKEDQEKLIGYAELKDTAPASSEDSKCFTRRIFVLCQGDYESYKNDIYPIEAVDPFTVQPKVRGLSPKKKAAQIAIRIPLSILRKLNTHIQKTGKSQTEIVINALAKYLDSTSEMSINDRVTALEERIAVLEPKDSKP